MLVNLIDRTWRLAGTGLAFAMIFGGGAVGAITILPLIAAMRLSGRGGTREAQYAIHWYFRFYIWLLQFLGVIAVDVQGQKELSRIHGTLVVANHPTLLDVVLLMAQMPRAQCIVKHELWNSRYLGGVMRVAGYIPNNLEPAALVEACRRSIELGDNLIIFPEGTRTKPGERPRFQRGFANIALLTAAPIKLVTITCTPLTLTKGEPWWRIPPRRPHFRVQVGDSLDTQELLRRQERSLAARALVRHLETYYGERLAVG